MSAMSKQRKNIFYVFLVVVATIGKVVISFLESMGKFAVFLTNLLLSIVIPPYYPRQIVSQFMEIGYFSLPVVALTTVFAGMVLALQIRSGMGSMSSESLVAPIVSIGILRELSPVLAGLMVAGRVGASMAAELGTMKVTEQVDALVTLSTNPMKYLIRPRVIAGTIALPLLIIIGDIIGVLGGYLVSIYRLHMNIGLYLQATLSNLVMLDLSIGIVKGLCFGFIITVLSCYHGLSSSGGAKGVGKATTNAVVASSISILFCNYIVTGFMV